MTEVKFEKPSEQIVKDIFSGKTITDSLGRILHLKKPNILDMYDLKRALKEDNDIDGCMELMVWILYVTKVGDAVFTPPISANEARASLKILGFEGRDAIIDFITKNSSESGGLEEVKK